MRITAFAGAAVALSAVAMAASPALAAGATPGYNAGTALHEAEKPKAPVDKPAPVPVLPQEEETPFVLPDGGTVLVRDFHLEGTEPTDEAEVRALLEPYRNRDLSLSEVYEAAAKVTNHYRGKGFMMAKAYVPRQDAGAGVLSIRVVIGRYGKTSHDNSSAIHDFLVEGTFDAIVEEGQPISKDGLERAMLLVSDMPGAQMPTVATAAGATPGTSDFMIKTDPTSRLTGYVLGDNFGSRYTGRDRLSAGVDLNAPLGLADKLSLSGMTSKAAGLQNGRAAYAFPLSYSGLRLELAASRTTYKLGDIYHDLEATGIANVWEGTLSYPLIRTSAESLWISVNAASKRLQDKQFDVTTASKRAETGTLAARNTTSGALFGFNLGTDVSSSLTFGNLRFPDSGQAQGNRAGVDTIGDYSKFNLSLGATLSFTDELSLAGSLKAQKALMGKNLDGSEQMSISGPAGVKSHVEGVMGDNGYLFNMEAKYTLPGIADFNHAVGLFTDMGRSYIQDRGYTSERNGTRLTDVGLGYYGNFQYDTNRYLVGKLLLTHAVGQQVDVGEKNARTKLLGQLGVTF